VSQSTFPNDPLWPRASEWLQRQTTAPQPDVPVDLGIIGIPAFRTSISPTGAHATPTAIREALMRYSTHAAGRASHIGDLNAHDFGDIEEPDGPEGEVRVREAVTAAKERCRLLIALGGDNSVTYSVMRGLAGDALADWGLVTVDAHHDVRDGETNGSPVRRLVDAGLSGSHIVQIGIADFVNSPAYAARAHELGITVIPRTAMRSRTMTEVADEALRVAGHGGRPVYVDLDVDVCDRSVAPACPASAPGGLAADELRELTFALASDKRVEAIDVTEVDATADTLDGRTVRLAALQVLEVAAGLASREGR
jgi:formiminoglutamase